jgi:hypothetical protein
MSETPEKKKARLRYDNAFKTAWIDEFHFIKHSRKGNKFAFCEFCRTAKECTILRPSEKTISGGGKPIYTAWNFLILL